VSGVCAPLDIPISIILTGIQYVAGRNLQYVGLVGPHPFIINRDSQIVWQVNIPV